MAGNRDLKVAKRGKGTAPSKRKPSNRDLKVANRSTRGDKNFVEKGVDPTPPPKLAEPSTPTPAPIEPGVAATEESKPSVKDRLGNVADVLGIAFNPFSKDKIVSNTANKVFNTAAEYVANSPYAAAGILTGVAGLVKGAITKFAIGKAVIPTDLAWSAGKYYAANTVTAKQTAVVLGGVMANLKKPAFVLSAVGAMIGTYPWAEWALGEAKEGMEFNTARALSTKDPAIIQEYMAEANEIYDITIYESLARTIPFANIAFAFGQKAKSLAAQHKVNTRLMQDSLTQIETGETDEEMWKRIDEEKIARAEAKRDRDIEAFKELDRYKEEAGDRDMEEDAAFWSAEKAKERKLQEADRQAVADFWTEYSKAKYKMQQSERPSSLNFGLL